MLTAMEIVPNSQDITDFPKREAANEKLHEKIDKAKAPAKKAPAKKAPAKKAAAKTEKK